MESIVKTKIRPVKNMETALYIYWNYPEIGNKEIAALFGLSGTATLARYKKIARQRMDEKGVECRGFACVDTATAFEAWGIDVGDLENRLIKIQRLKQKNLIKTDFAVDV
ncbi:MAG: hypothetical protein HFE77_03250 [Clostridiales bacterium]|nr:hypothetical protein [Clostridiales bacterium]